MGRNAKLGIAVAAVVVLAGIGFAMKSTVLVIAVVLLGGIGIFFLLQQQDDDRDDDGGGSTRTKPKPAKAKKGKAKLDEILDDQAKSSGTTTTNRTPLTGAPSGGGLPTWTPGSVGSSDDAGASLDDLDTTDGSWDTWEKEWPGDGGSLSLDDDPLASLDRLDEIDPVAEVERLDAADDPFAALRSDIEVDDTFELDELDDFDVDLGEPEPAAKGGGFSFSSASVVVNEDVSSADDIMAASTATELHMDDGDSAADGDSELARLLAKVQARLSAYE